MALIQADRVKETSTTTGTGNFTLAGAVTGFRTFSTGVGVGNTCYYVITDNNDYEVGLGTLNSTSVLARTTVLTSSNSNNAVDWGAGSKDVFTTYPGPKAVILDSNNELSLGSALGVAGNVSVGGTFQVTGEFNLSDISASGTLDVAGTTNLATASITGTVNVTGETTLDDVSASGTLDVAGETNLATATITGNLSADGTLNISGNGSVGGTFNVEGDLKNTSGNLTVDPATKIFEIKGGGSTDGQIKLNCRSNSHGQILKSQDHSAGVTNTMLLPRGANSTLVSEVADQELSFKKMGALLREHSKINTNATTGTINFSARDQNVVLRTTNASGNFVLNIRGNASTSLNNSMETEESISIAFEVKQGGTAYYMTTLQIDGSTVSPVYWQGGTAPSEGTANGYDSYVINITKTGDATFTVLASLTSFGSVS